MKHTYKPVANMALGLKNKIKYRHRQFARLDQIVEFRFFEQAEVAV